MCKDHGYLSGEQFTCPKCGGKTEVYSRITGYYRPVQNWNDGKAQEFKDRKVYDVAHSALKHSHAVAAADCKHEASVTAKASKALLFATHTCPNCRTAEAALQRCGIAYSKSFAEENAALCEQFGIRQAPTLVVTEGGRTEKYAGASDIIAYAEAAKTAAAV